MPISINWDEGGSDFDVLPEDKYVVRVSDIEIRTSGPNSKNPGAQYLNIEATVQDGDHKNRKLWDTFSLLPQARPFLKEWVETLTGDKLSGDGQLEPMELIGKPALVYAIVTGKKDSSGNAMLDANGNPQLRNEIKTWLPYTEGAESGGFKPF